MKLQCQVEVINRTHAALNVRRGGTKFAKSTLALGKECKNESEYFMILFTTTNKTGTRYKVNKNVKQVFTKFLNEGKSTIRFEEPAHDLCIRCEPIQLKSFMKLLSTCLSGKDLNLVNLSNISITAKDHAPTKLIIKDRSEIPSKGLPRTLTSLYMIGLNLSNFRREILQLRHLTVLDMRNNELEKIPQELGRMACITELYLQNNKLGLHGEVDWRWLTGPQLSKSLRLLDIRNNALSYISNKIWMVDGLITLNLDDNLLTTIPSSLGRINTLRYLTLRNNRLTSLPFSIVRLNLEHMDTSGNEWEPEEQRNLQERQELGLYDLSISCLTSIAGTAVVKYKLMYNERTIPFTLVNFLNNATFCVCGNPVLDKRVYRIMYDVKDYIQHFVSSQSNVITPVDCSFCSLACFNYQMTKGKFMI